MRILYKTVTNKRQNKGSTIRSFFILNRFFTGVKITKSSPRTLLIKNRGYLKIFVQKLFITALAYLSKKYFLLFKFMLYCMDSSTRLCSSVVRAGDS